VRILDECPESPLADQARIWVSVLQENKSITQMLEHSTQTMKEFDRLIRPEVNPEEPDQLIKPEVKPEEPSPTQENLLRGQLLLAQGDYEGSVNENQKVLSMAAHRPPEDEALFNLGLVYAHFLNPKKDFGKSIDFLNKLVKDYPGSPLVEQAKIWIKVLQEDIELNQVIEKLKQVDIEVEEKKKKAK
jgi:hypothetical protein